MLFLHLLLIHNKIKIIDFLHVHYHEKKKTQEHAKYTTLTIFICFDL